MFNLTIKAADQKIKYKAFSIGLKFLVDEKKLDESFDNLITVLNIGVSALNRKTFLSKEGTDIRISNPAGKPDEIVISKIVHNEEFSPDYFRNYLAGFLASLEKEEVTNLHIFIPPYETFKEQFASPVYYFQSFVEGLLLGNYTFDNYKQNSKAPKDLAVYLHGEGDKNLEYAIERAMALKEGYYFAKDLQNEPANTLTPAEMADRIARYNGKNSIKVKVFDEKEIKKRGMGGLMAVGSGSDNPPRFIIMEYNPAGEKSKKKLKKIALVGKGMTFDSGGISIKPAANMGEMKADMSGAAAVAGTIIAAAKAKLQVHLIGVIPSAENMLSGSAFRPGDIVKSASGKTIEIDNTDAEGRVILSDALDYASKVKPDVIIDLATLTGACVVALGEFVSGLFTKNEELKESIYKAGLRTYDRVWPMPMWDEYHTLNKSDVADVKNLGGRWGGAISAAKFLENFVDKNIPWAHIDIAGPTAALTINNYSKKYLNPAGVRLLFDYLSES